MSRDGVSVIVSYFPSSGTYVVQCGTDGTVFTSLEGVAGYIKKRFGINK